MSISSVLKSKDNILETLKNIQREVQQNSSGQTNKQHSSSPSFLEHIQNATTEVNSAQKKADTMAIELTTGKTGNIHETMLAATQAELSFNLMVQLRNKALEAYNEIMRMPV